MLPWWPPSRGLLSLIRREGPIRLDQVPLPRPARPPKSPPLTRAGCWQLYGRATEQLAPGTFRSKTHYKECLKGLRQQQKVWTYRDAKVGRGAKSRDILAVNANVDNRRWAGLERRLGQLREREARGL